jgi:hypothetical protein
MRDPSDNYKSKRSEIGFGVCKLRSVIHTPLGDFDPEEIYGATFTVGDSASTAEHGMATCLAELVKPE